VSRKFAYFNHNKAAGFSGFCVLWVCAGQTKVKRDYEIEFVMRCKSAIIWGILSPNVQTILIALIKNNLAT
jgi:hypothetical protein